MKNITLSIDDDLYRAARIAAAERDTTVSALVRDFLQRLTRPANSPDDLTAALFLALDQAKPNRASDRPSREETHDRRVA